MSYEYIYLPLIILWPRKVYRYLKDYVPPKFDTKFATKQKQLTKIGVAVDVVSNFAKTHFALLKRAEQVLGNWRCC